MKAGLFLSQTSTLESENRRQSLAREPWIPRDNEAQLEHQHWSLKGVANPWLENLGRHHNLVLTMKTGLHHISAWSCDIQAGGSLEWHRDCADAEHLRWDVIFFALSSR